MPRWDVSPARRLPFDTDVPSGFQYSDDGALTHTVIPASNAFPMYERNWSVYAVWITGEHKHEYAKVRADEGVIGLGRGVSIQRSGMKSRDWQAARVVEAPDNNGLGSLVWLTLGEM